MQKIISIFVLLICTSGVQAQSDAMYSQYMFNSLLINPAQAGSLDHINATILAREQWTGLAGRPRTQTIALDGITHDLKHGFGLTMLNDKIGSTRATKLSFMYSYRISFTSKTKLAFGLQGSGYNFNTDYSGLRVEDGTDPTIGGNTVNLWRPDVGAGAFFHTNHVFMGISAPSILDWDIAKTGGSTARRGRTWFGTAGVIARVSENVHIRPSVMLKFQPNMPFQADFNIVAFLMEKFWIGGSYRLEDAVVLMAQWQINSQWRLGYAYDISTSDIRSYSGGSHELMLAFSLHFQRDNSVDPRFFR